MGINAKVVLGILASLLLVAIAYGQDGKTFRLSGKLPEHSNVDFAIGLDYDPSNQLEGAIVANGKTDSQGNLSTEFKVDDGQVFVLMIGPTYYRLWAEPGNELALSHNENRDFVCSGSLSKKNQFLFDSMLADPLAHRPNGKFKPTERLASIDAQFKKQMSMLEKSSQMFGNKDPFLTYVKAQIIGMSANQKNNSAMMAINTKELSKSDLPDNYFDFWRALPVLEDSAAMLSRSYKEALRGKLQYMAEKELIKEGMTPADHPVLWSKRQLKIQGKHLAKQPKTHELMFASQVMFMIQYMPLDEVESVIADFSTQFPTSKFLFAIDDTFARTKKIDLAAIDKACEFTDINGNRVRFSDLRDKVVYIDFWGLWCKGCMTHQPDLEKLIDRLADKDEIAVLSIDFFDTNENWKAHVQEKKLKGLHWKPTKSTEEKAKELFLLNAFPRYMIFGKKGELISGSAPIPSHKRLLDMLTEAAK